MQLKMLRGREVPKYCWRCGSSLKETRFFTGRYDEYTGEKMWGTRLECGSPNGLLKFFTNHESIEFDHNGDEIIYVPDYHL